MLKHTKHSPLAIIPLAVSLLPSVALAAPQVCAHPLEAAHCIKTYSLVSVAYIVFAGAYAAAALSILKPRFARTRAWALSLLATPLASYLIAMLGFTLGGATGLFIYPHDASPFFYMDWFQVIFVLLGVSGYVALCTKLGGAPKAPQDPAQPEPQAT